MIQINFIVDHKMKDSEYLGSDIDGDVTNRLLETGGGTYKSKYMDLKNAVADLYLSIK